MAKRIKKQVEVIEPTSPFVEKDSAGRVISHAAALPVLSLDDIAPALRAAARKVFQVNKDGGYAPAEVFAVGVPMPLDYRYDTEGIESLHSEQRILALKVSGYSSYGTEVRLDAEFGIASKQTMPDKWATDDQGEGSTYSEFQGEASLKVKASLFEDRVYLEMDQVNTYAGGYRRSTAEGVRFFAKSVQVAALIAEQMPARHATIEENR